MVRALRRSTDIVGQTTGKLGTITKETASCPTGRIFMESRQISRNKAGLGEERCRSCQTCDAPLCPLDKGIDRRCWYPDEEICKVNQFSGIDWIKNQRKIKKRAIDMSRYFTLEMLKRNCVIRRGIKGLSSNLPCDTEKMRIQRWLAKHAPRRSISSEERERMAERMRRLRTCRK